MTTSPDELFQMAAECRELAAATALDVIREQLLETAEQFERLARFNRDRERMLWRQLAD